MAEFQAAIFSKEQTEQCIVFVINDLISTAIKQGKYEITLPDHLTNSVGIIKKLKNSGYIVEKNGNCTVASWDIII